MTCVIRPHTAFYLIAYSILLVTRTGTENLLARRQITILTRAVGVLVLISIGLLALPSLSLALEKYGRPLPSME